MIAKLSIILPVLNEAATLAARLQALQYLRSECELILVDGGSQDKSPAISAALVDSVLVSARGRAWQMNAGAEAASGDILLFLHADTRLPDDALTLIQQAVANGFQWGRFDVAFDDAGFAFKLIAFFMNRRSRWTGIATGDQALFMTRQAYQEVGGFPDIALMEDIAISKRLKGLGKPCCLDSRVVTAARRWQQKGIVGTILLMWYLRLAYFFGASPARLAVLYYGRS
jgi:rSAM/selenodomain-associated transferase 2